VLVSKVTQADEVPAFVRHQRRKVRTRHANLVDPIENPPSPGAPGAFGHGWRMVRLEFGGYETNSEATESNALLESALRVRSAVDVLNSNWKPI